MDDGVQSVANDPDELPLTVATRYPWPCARRSIDTSRSTNSDATGDPRTRVRRTPVSLENANDVERWDETELRGRCFGHVQFSAAAHRSDQSWKEETVKG